MRSKIESILLFLSFLSLPTQLGKHFWPSFARIEGIRVDYLSPTIYLSDIAIILFIATCLINRRKKILPKKLNKSLAISFVLLLLALLLHSLFAKSPQAAAYGSIKLAEFLAFGYCIARYDLHRATKLLTYSFLISLPFQSYLAIAQFIRQETLGGIWYFLGERSFTASTPGIATFFLNGKEILRPYATFSHPNVLGFYLLMANIFLITIKDISSKPVKYYTYLLVIISSTVLLLTFSRVTTLLYVIFLLIWNFMYFKKKFNQFIIVCTIIGFFIIFTLFFHSRFFDREFIQKDISLRIELNKIAVDIWTKSPLFGVGLKNFFVYQIDFQKKITPTLLQPVHNIYLLTLTETGLFGLIALVMVLLSAFTGQFKNNKFVRSYPIIFILLFAGIVGLFDHYLLTVQQGQLMLALIVGLSFTKTTSSTSIPKKSG